MTTTLLTLNKPNSNSRIYSTEVIETAIEKSRILLERKRLFVSAKMNSESSGLNIENVVGIVKDLKIEGNNLIGEIDFLPELLEKHFPSHLPSFEDQFNKTLFVRPSGMGTVKNGIISDYIINYFFLTDDPT